MLGLQADMQFNLALAEDLLGLEFQRESLPPAFISSSYCARSGEKDHYQRGSSVNVPTELVASWLQRISEEHYLGVKEGSGYAAGNGNHASLAFEYPDQG